LSETTERQTKKRLNQIKTVLLVLIVKSFSFRITIQRNPPENVAVVNSAILTGFKTVQTQSEKNLVFYIKMFKTHFD
jgi:hypothetical protein